ncbi:hypothetical protein KY339_05575 [Candidatus Woesearchaeota archaeon]|nr:hypothetical protein [Candidatus Woesearchaeota archaeon]
MAKINVVLQKQKYNFFGRKIKRKEFKVSTKKRVWMKAGGNDPFEWRRDFAKTSICMGRGCHKKLLWDKGNYKFKYKDNYPSNNSENNCLLMCKDCCQKRSVIVKKNKK